MNGRSFYPPGRTKRVELPESPVRGRGLTWLASPTGPRTRSASPMGSPLASSSTLRASPIASKSSAMMRARAAADAGGAMDSKTSLLVPSALGRADRLGANRAQMGMDRSPGEVERAKKVAIAEQKAVLVEREIAKKKRRNRSRFRPVACFRFVATFAQAVTGLGGDRAWALINPTSRIVAQSLVSTCVCLCVSLCASPPVLPCACVCACRWEALSLRSATQRHLPLQSTVPAH